MKVVTAKEMQAIDRKTIKGLGMPVKIRYYPITANPLIIPKR